MLLFFHRRQSTPASRSLSDPELGKKFGETQQTAASLSSFLTAYGDACRVKSESGSGTTSGETSRSGSGRYGRFLESYPCCVPLLLLHPISCYTCACLVVPFEYTSGTKQDISLGLCLACALSIIIFGRIRGYTIQCSVVRQDRGGVLHIPIGHYNLIYIIAYCREKTLLTGKKVERLQREISMKTIAAITTIQVQCHRSFWLLLMTSLDS